MRDATLEGIRRHPVVRSADQVDGDRRTMRVVVADAADDAIAALTPWLADNGADVRLAERWIAPFDDVFVGLVERHRA